MGFVGGGVELRQDDAIGGDYQITAVDAEGFRRVRTTSAWRISPAHSESAAGRPRVRSAHPSMLMNLFDSHDTARALWMLRGDTAALKLLLLMQSCAPGPPMVYQGTEVGQIGAGWGWRGAAETPQPPGVPLARTRRVGPEPPRPHPRHRTPPKRKRRPASRGITLARRLEGRLGRDPFARDRVGPIFRLGPRRRDAPLRLSRGK